MILAHKDLDPKWPITFFLGDYCDAFNLNCPRQWPFYFYALQNAVATYLAFMNKIKNCPRDLPAIPKCSFHKLEKELVLALLIKEKVVK